MMAKEVSEALIDELYSFKRKCEILHCKNFLALFDKQGNLFHKEPSWDSCQKPKKIVEALEKKVMPY